MERAGGGVAVEGGRTRPSSGRRAGGLVANEGLSAGAVARRLGIAVTTLRTWHQRYGLGPSEHRPGHHRRYSPTDLARLEVMRRLTAQGIPAAEAARVAMASWPGGRPVEPVASGRAGGGHTIPVGRSGAAAQGLARAAVRLDAPTMRTVVEEAVAEIGVVETWDRVVRPVLAGIGARHAATRRLVEVEHLLTRCVSEVFGAVPRPGPSCVPRALLACADDEQHSLPLEALAAALAERGVSCRLLGARVPVEALLQAVRRTGPVVVLVWSHVPTTADRAQLRALLEMSPRPAVVAAGGPGWPADGLPAGVERLADLTSALELIVAVTQA